MESRQPNRRAFLQGSLAAAGTAALLGPAALAPAAARGAGPITGPLRLGGPAFANTDEVMGWSWPDSPEHYLKMIKAVDRPGFAVHLDPCNLVNSPEKFYDNRALLNECFDKLGRWIVSCHAKDLTWDVEMNLHFREVAPGKGALDYATYLKRLAQLPHRPPLMLEHLATAEDYAGAKEHVFQVGRQAGLSFS